jgi:hypothetical protein
MQRRFLGAISILSKAAYLSVLSPGPGRFATLVAG